MADKPIIFSAPMIRALLEGRKMQTRRVVKIKGHLAGHTFTGDLVDYYGNGRLGMAFEGTTLVHPLPYAPGDRLWVREACHIDGSQVNYRADAPEGSHPPGPWRPSIHMPRWASRLTLTVTDVRLQRVQDISEADARAEGVIEDALETPLDVGQEAKRHLFSDLWNSLHGPDAWDRNDWVVALTFDVHQCNIDQMPGGESDE